MLVAIISDIHDNLVNLERCLNWCRNSKIEVMICCGDITNSETIEYLSKHFFGEIHLVKGNVELYSEAKLKRYKNIVYYGKIGRFEIGNRIVGACHEPFYIEDVIKQGKCDIIFYGHTHKEEEKILNNTLLINPGEIAGIRHGP